MSFVPNGSGAYSFSVSVSDGDDSTSDSVSFIFDEFYVEPTSREAVTSEELSWLISPSVSNSTEAGNLLDQVYVVAQATLAENVITGVIEALDTVVSSNIALSANQVSQTLASFDNIVDENASLSTALSESQMTATSNLLMNVLSNNSSVVSTKDYLKALEVFDEVLEPYATGSGVKANLSDGTEQALGEDLASIVDAAAGNLLVGESIDYKKGQLTVLASAYLPTGTAMVIEDASDQLSMTIPANFSTSNLTVSVTKYEFNPHVVGNPTTPDSNVVSFKIRDLATLQDVSFGSQTVALKLPVTGTPGANQGYVARYFDTSSNTWLTTGISSTDTGTSGEVSFDTSHLTDFAVFIESTATSVSSGGGGGGGCMLGTDY
jgi:hypothetical protein